MDHLGAEDQEFEELEIAEEELIDAYVRNELPAPDRKLVEKGLLSSRKLVNRFHFARLLAKAASSIPQQQTSASAVESAPSFALPDPDRARIPWWKAFLGPVFAPPPAVRMALGACVILILIGGVALFSGWMQLRSESRRFDSERAALEQRRQELERKSAEQQSRSEQLTAELQKEKQQREKDEKLIEELKRSQNQNQQSQGAISIASILLFPGSTRDVNGGKELIVPPGASTVRLKLGLEANDYSSYGAVIKNAQGLEVFRKNGLKIRSGTLVTLQLPAQRLPPGNYTIRLRGVTSSGAVEPASDYAFRITAKEK